MEGFEDPLNRRCFPWGREDRELTDFYRRLGKIKTAEKALREGEIRLEFADDEILCFVREWEGERICVAVNRAGEAYPLPEGQMLIGEQCASGVLSAGGFAVLRMSAPPCRGINAVRRNQKITGEC